MSLIKLIEEWNGYNEWLNETTHRDIKIINVKLNRIRNLEFQIFENHTKDLVDRIKKLESDPKSPFVVPPPPKFYAPLEFQQYLIEFAKVNPDKVELEKPTYDDYLAIHEKAMESWYQTAKKMKEIYK